MQVDLIVLKEESEGRGKEKISENQKTEFVHDKKAFAERIISTLNPKMLKIMIGLLFIMVAVSVGINLFLLMEQFTLVETLIKFQRGIKFLSISGSTIIKIAKATLNIYSYNMLNYTNCDIVEEKKLMGNLQSIFQHNFSEVYATMRTTSLQSKIFNDFYITTYNKYRLDGTTIDATDDSIIDIVDSVYCYY